jgi:probable F420-dependent oxidoreductase
MQLSGTGVWSPHLRYGDPAATAHDAAELDALGYSALWVPDVGGDVLASVEHLLDVTNFARIATGVLNIWMHQPSEIAARRASWRDDWQARFVMGLGVSHAVLIDLNDPGRYTKPYSKMVAFVDELDNAGFPRDARLLAALGPKMLNLARERAAGAHPYFVPVEHIAEAREILGPEPVIAAELAVVVDANPSSARDTARRHTQVYVTLPNYTNNLRRFGFGDADFADKGSDKLVDAIVAWGTIDTIASRVQAMRAAGANHVCIQVIRSDDEVPRDDWRELAPALVELE